MRNKCYIDYCLTDYINPVQTQPISSTSARLTRLNNIVSQHVAIDIDHLLKMPA